MKKKGVMIASSLILLTAAAGYGGWKYHTYRKQKEAEAMAQAQIDAEKSLDVIFAQNSQNVDTLRLSYSGTDIIQTGDLIAVLVNDKEAEISEEAGTWNTEDPKVTLQVSPETIDPAAMDSAELTTSVSCIVSVKDTYEQTVQKTFRKTIVIEDTQAPEITIKESEISFDEGTAYEPRDNIENVKDPIDGDLTPAGTLEKGTYTINTDLDTESPGEYTVTVNAMDNHGLTSESSFTVTVNEVIEETEPVIVTANPYYIRINRVLNTVTVYTNDGTPYMAMVCSTGPATPTGTYYTFNKSRWRSLFGGVYGQYTTDIVGDILFHSVPYLAMDQSTLETWEYNKLGTAASMGCIRLQTVNAKWIYDNCPIGTLVEIYDDYDSPGPLGKPSIDLIDESSAGWDPTDPDCP